MFHKEFRTELKVTFQLSKRIHKAVLVLLSTGHFQFTHRCQNLVGSEVNSYVVALEANAKVSLMGRCQNSTNDSAIFSNSRPKEVLTFRIQLVNPHQKKRSENHGFQWRWRCFRIDIASAHATRVASALSALAPPFAHPQVT